jgi:hypothetical protein
MVPSSPLEKSMAELTRPVSSFVAPMRVFSLSPAQ